MEDPARYWPVLSEISFLARISRQGKTKSGQQPGSSQGFGNDGLSAAGHVLPLAILQREKPAPAKMREGKKALGAYPGYLQFRNRLLSLLIGRIYGARECGRPAATALSRSASPGGTRGESSNLISLG